MIRLRATADYVAMVKELAELKEATKPLFYVILCTRKSDNTALIYNEGDKGSFTAYETLESAQEGVERTIQFSSWRYQIIAMVDPLAIPKPIPVEPEPEPVRAITKFVPNPVLRMQQESDS